MWKKFYNIIKEYGIFLWTFFKSPVCNAAIAPSSTYLAKQMVKNIDWTQINSVIELWPGTGVFTQAIVNNANPNTKIITIEIEKQYNKMLKQKFWKKIIIENQSAHLLDKILNKHWLAKPDLIISWLGYLCMPEDILIQILAHIQNYTAQWTIFRTFTYVPYRLRKVFHQFKIKRIWHTYLNIPPAYVFGIN